MRSSPSSLGGPTPTHTLAAEIGDSFASSIRWLTTIGLALGFGLLAKYPEATILVAAIMCGYSEVNGACGASHVGSLTPLRVCMGPRVWAKAVAAYTLAGILTASFVGAIVSQLGRLLGIHAFPSAAFSAIVLLAIALVVREIGWIRFPLPQVHRQTQKMWADTYGFVTGAGMWGAHIGLAFFTVVRHGGFYVVAAAALAWKPYQSATLFAVYWIGRTLPIWLMPALSRGRNDSASLARQVLGSEKALRYLSAAGLLVVGCAAAVISRKMQ